MNVYVERPDDAEGGPPAAGSAPLCREPWEHYYILRRGIVPCCYGNPVLAPMSEWAETWNSPVLQEMRSYLSRGELSPYCLRSPSCPIVQRVLAEKPAAKIVLAKKPGFLRLLNRMLGGVPGRVYRVFRRRGV